MQCDPQTDVPSQVAALLHTGPSPHQALLVNICLCAAGTRISAPQPLYQGLHSVSPQIYTAVILQSRLESNHMRSWAF